MCRAERTGVRTFGTWGARPGTRGGRLSFGSRSAGLGRVPGACGQVLPAAPRRSGSLHQIVVRVGLPSARLFQVQQAALLSGSLPPSQPPSVSASLPLRLPPSPPRSLPRFLPPFEPPPSLRTLRPVHFSNILPSVPSSPSFRPQLEARPEGTRTDSEAQRRLRAHWQCRVLCKYSAEMMAMHWQAGLRLLRPSLSTELS